MNDPSTADLSRRLLVWYDRHRRTLPWRAGPGERADPYRVWLSEIMLQQTTVATVTGYFDRFMARWPTVRDLAAASLDEVLHAWQGLGYYARARNLHACARAVVRQHDGRFPADEAALRRLPGIGSYTAAAIAAIAFDHHAVVMDGNVERVVARLYAVTTELPAAKPVLKSLAGGLTPRLRAGDHAQAMMDLGATVCTPRKPACAICPWLEDCRARCGGLTETLPAKAAKPERPTRHGIAFWAERQGGEILIRRRPDEGLLGGLMELPSTPWRATPWLPEEAFREAPVPAAWLLLPGMIEHVFTHFRLVLGIAVAEVPTADGTGVWVRPADLGDHALPTLMRKVVRARLAQLPAASRAVSGPS